MATVVAKFRVLAVTTTMGNKKVTVDGEEKWIPAEVKSIRLGAVYDPDPNHENHKFWEATPSGQIELNIVNAGAADMLRLNDEFYVYFSAEKLV